jgi:hypothetical protein
MQLHVQVEGLVYEVWLGVGLFPSAKQLHWRWESGRAFGFMGAEGPLERQSMRQGTVWVLIWGNGTLTRLDYTL